MGRRKRKEEENKKIKTTIILRDVLRIPVPEVPSTKKTTDLLADRVIAYKSIHERRYVRRDILALKSLDLPKWLSNVPFCKFVHRYTDFGCTETNIIYKFI